MIDCPRLGRGDIYFGVYIQTEPGGSSWWLLRLAHSRSDRTEPEHDCLPPPWGEGGPGALQTGRAYAPPRVEYTFDSSL